MTRRRCDECGCFLRGDLRHRYVGMKGILVELAIETGTVRCHVCALARMTSQEVRWDDDEERGYDAEGESLNAIEHRAWLDHWYGNGTASARALANSTDDTRATSSWLPPGSTDWTRPVHPAFVDDEAYRAWLADADMPPYMRSMAMVANPLGDNDARPYITLLELRQRTGLPRGPGVDSGSPVVSGE